MYQDDTIERKFSFLKINFGKLKYRRSYNYLNIFFGMIYAFIKIYKIITGNLYEK